ncbi:MAG: F0F1 ATP synthase subunit delta [Myxococcales bacterium]|nr:F0F1 ATP synthase subunit delta [Myxococcales bacterium]
MLIDWFTVAAQVINFLVLAWLLRRFLFGPIVAAIDAREAHLADTIAEAERREAAAAEAQAGFETQRKTLEAERAERLRAAEVEAASERGRLLEEARGDAQKVRAAGRAALREELAAVERSLGTLARDEVVAIAERALAELAGARLDERIVETLIERLGALDADARGPWVAALRAGGADVRTARPLSEAQRAALTEALCTLAGAPIEVRETLAPALVSGVEVEADGYAVAWNVQRWLGDLRARAEALARAAEGAAEAPDDAA